jgi:hypothetical protein
VLPEPNPLAVIRTPRQRKEVGLALSSFERKHQSTLKIFRSDLHKSRNMLLGPDLVCSIRMVEALYAFWRSIGCKSMK